jgi:hypothetical protein
VRKRAPSGRPGPTSEPLRSLALLGLIKDIGAIAGLVSFVAMIGLLVLYLMRARELRKLRHSAPFLVDVGNGRSTARSRRQAAKAARKRLAR